MEHENRLTLIRFIENFCINSYLDELDKIPPALLIRIQHERIGKGHTECVAH